MSPEGRRLAPGAMSIACVYWLAVAAVQAAPEANYQEPFRPQYHFTPPTGWMGDPSALVYEHGRYHLFYWGHAVSRDLLHWQIWPRVLQSTDEVATMSGSAVVDEADTSDFGIGRTAPWVAVYSALQRTDRRQTQDIAFSNDGGRTFTRFPGNPVIDIGSTEFRDPQVFWYGPGRRWEMVVALAADHAVRFYSSRDLKVWTLQSEFGPGGDADGVNTDGVWECPDLIPLSIDGGRRSAWLLKVDLQPTGARYFIGEFDGSRFRSGPATTARRVDFGDDFYAARSWHGEPDRDGRRIWIGWMNNWRYARDVPTAPWKGMQSIPRELSLRSTPAAPAALALVQSPIRELRRLRGHHWHWNGMELRPDGHVALAARGVELEIQADFERGTASEFGLAVRKGAGAGGAEQTLLGYDSAAAAVFVDRSHSGRSDFNATFAARHEAPLALRHGRVRLRAFVDASSVETFWDDGVAVISDQIFPAAGSDAIAPYAVGGTARLVGLDVWQLKSTTPPKDSMSADVRAAGSPE